MTRGRIAALAIVAALAASPAAASPSAEERAEIQATISAQIEAFRRDDGAAAYAIASDPIRELFTSEGAFLDMVRRGYAPVYRPRSIVFGPVTDGEMGLEQEVFVTDAEGVDWIAKYALVRDASGHWRVNGCRLLKNERSSA